MINPLVCDQVGVRQLVGLRSVLRLYKKNVTCKVEEAICGNDRRNY